MANPPKLEPEYLTPEPMPREFDTRRLARRAAVAVAFLAVLLLIAWLAPGLGEVRTLVGRADPAWLGLAVALEIASSLSYVAMFRPVFCRRMSWRSSGEIGLSELAVGSIVPASGAGGVALGAWILSRYGMPGEIIARRSVAFLLIKSSVNFVAVAVLGVLMFCGVGPSRSAALTLLPAALAVAALLAVILVARASAAVAEGGTGRWRKLVAALASGMTEAGRLLRKGDPLLIGGSIGYWLFDNLVLLAAFHAFGVAPPLTIVLMAYLIGQLGGALPLPGGLGGIDGGLIGTLIVYGVAAAPAAAAVLLYRVVLFWVPLIMGVPAFISLRRGLDDDRRPDLCLPVASASAPEAA
jgi:glycosyltransferase 2 family protein